MPEQAIPILRASNAARAVAFYERLGFVEAWTHRFEPELPAFTAVARGETRVFLSEHEGDAPPQSLLYLRLANVADLATALDVPLVRQPWDCDEIEVQDPDGNRLRIGWPVGPST